MSREMALGSLIAKMAVTDEQTGLLTFHHFQQLLEQELERARRYGHKLTVVYAHLDARLGFSSPAELREGDKVLRAFAAVLKATARSVDIAARRGVADFAIALPETDAEAARFFGKRLIEKLAATSLGGRERGEATVSLGAATFPQHAQDLRELLSLAERTVARVAAEGGDRYAAYDPGWDAAPEASPPTLQ